MAIDHFDIWNEQRVTFGSIPAGMEKVQGGDLPKLWWENLDSCEQSQAKKVRNEQPISAEYLEMRRGLAPSHTPWQLTPK